jgi:hypothetical protein
MQRLDVFVEQHHGAELQQQKSAGDPWPHCRSIPAVSTLRCSGRCSGRWRRRGGQPRRDVLGNVREEHKSYIQRAVAVAGDGTWS